MNDHMLLRLVIDKARLNVPILGKADIDVFQLEAGLLAEYNADTFINHVRAGGAGLAEEFARSIERSPDKLDVISRLLVAAEPVGPVATIVAETLRTALPSHPLSRPSTQWAACFVFSAMGVLPSEAVVFPKPKGEFSSGPVVLLDFDAPLARWAEGEAVVEGDQVTVVDLRTSGLAIDCFFVPPLIVFSRVA